MDVQKPEILEDAVGKMIQLAPGGQIQVSTVAFIDVPVSQATEEITGVAKLISEGELRNRTVEQPVASFMPPIQNEIVKTIWFIPQERVFDRNAERVIDVSVPHIPEHCIEVGKVFLQERAATTYTEADHRHACSSDMGEDRGSRNHD